MYRPFFPRQQQRQKMIEWLLVREKCAEFVRVQRKKQLEEIWRGGFIADF